MTTFIKMKFKLSDDQTNIDKFRLAANIIEYHRYQNYLTTNHYYNFEVKYKIGCGLPIDLQRQRKK